MLVAPAATEVQNHRINSVCIGGRTMVTVVLDGPSQFPLRSLRRFVAGLIGGVVFLAGLFSVVPFVLLSLVGSETLFGSNDQGSARDELPPALAGHLLRYWLIAAGLVIFGIPLGKRLVRGHRELVLFLRRFGYNDATRTISSAIPRIGASWRIVTLDDSQIVPVGVEPSALGIVTRMRRATSLLKRASTLVVRVYKVAMGTGALAAAAIVGITYLRREDIGSLFESVLSDQAKMTSLSAPFRALLIGLAVGAAAWGVFVLGVLISVALAPIWGWVSSTSDAVQDAERAKHFEIHDGADLTKATSEVVKWRRRVFSPRLIVLTVDSNLWQTTMQVLTTISAVVLVDVSVPTENLLWEIETLKAAHYGDRCLFVGNIERLGRFTGEEPPALSGSVTHRADALIDNETILAYSPNDRDPQRFTRALRAMLQEHVRRTSATRTAR
jgi:hypothetical protein